MRPEDFERYRKLIRDAERMRRSVGDVSKIQSMLRQAERARRMALGAANQGPSPADLEYLRREVEAAQRLYDPRILRAHADAQRIAAKYNSALAQMPDAATQRAVLEATRYLNSDEFRAHRDAILRANEIAQQRLGIQGLAAAERIAALRTAADGSQQRAAELIRSGQGTRLLEEASELAASPQVRESLERADLEALVQLDEEQPDVPTQEMEVEPSGYEDDLQEVPKEVLLARYRRALLVLLPLHAALAIEAAATGASPGLASLSDYVGALIELVAWLELIISARDDD